MSEFYCTIQGQKRTNEYCVNKCEYIAKVHCPCNVAYQNGRADAIEECLDAIGGFSIAWEYGQGVMDCYNAIKKLKEQK